MTGRHRKPRRLSKEGRRLLGGAALLAIFAPVTVYTLNAAIAHVQSCGTETSLTVAAAPELAPVLERFIAEGGGAPSRGSDVCADFTVTAVDSAAIGEAEADVWIPETELWLGLPEAGLADQWEVLEPSTASSAVGLALPVGEDPNAITPEDSDVALDDPRQDAGSLMWIVMFGVDQDTVDGAEADGAYPVMSAPEVAMHNTEEGDDLQVPSGAAQVGQFEYPMLVSAGLGDDKREAAANLVRSYGSPEYDDLLTQNGFGMALPEPPRRGDTAVETALASWDSYA
ncbi:hypothetical protein [Glycomyces buryatensis]|uniref:Uncharacterized protein n=1 Tax=Glycomyces buryatensis TaxID=2570927 RepID=A0A4S8QFZ0_9ACTN|nr:hypothetical protein [Glycomyces buryatensis]THV41855.1 hypothetical protein FAB82_09030 [Glycomyces buryatensis]